MRFSRPRTTVSSAIACRSSSWLTVAAPARTSQRTSASIAAASPAGSTPIVTAASTPSARARPKAPSPRSPPRWPTRSSAGSSRGRPNRGWTGPTGPTRSSPTTCTRLNESRPRAPPCSASAPRSASACTARPTATCAATPTSRPRPRRTSPVSKKGGGGGDRPAEPGRGAVPDGADVGGDVGGQGAPPSGRDQGLQGPAVRLLRGQPGLGGGPQQHAGEPQGCQEADGQEQDAADAGGLRRPSQACGQGLPQAQVPGGSDPDRQRAVAPGQDDRRGTA